MKKSLILKIIFLLIMFLLIVSFLFHFIYFSSLHKKIRPLSEAEKQKVIKILNNSVGLDNYGIKIGNIYFVRGKEMVQVELIKDNSKKHYFVDIEEGKIIGR